MSAVWTRLLSAFVRPATPGSGLELPGTLDGAAEGASWAPPVAPAISEADDGSGGRARARAAAPAEPAAVAVLAAPRAARAVGAAVALSAGAGPVLLGCWGVARLSGGLTAPVSPAARRLAATLAGRGLDARGTGRLVELRLPEDEEAAVDALRRAEAVAVAAGAPSVVALGAARGEAWDGVLATRDAVLVHGTDEAIVELALAQLASIGADARRLDHVPSRATLALATAGVMPWGGAGGLRAVLGTAS